MQQDARLTNVKGQLKLCATSHPL